MIVACHQRFLKKAAILLSMAKNSGFLLTSIKPFIAVLLLLIFCFSSPHSAQANGPIPFTENFDIFTGDGFSPTPAVGQLDSNIWIANGLSEGNMLFGDTQTAGDFARGTDPGGVTTGGIYAFDTGGNIILGIQPGAEDFTPGNITLRLQNNTGDAITHLNVSYDIWYLNDQGRANLLNFSYSPDNVLYISVPALDFTTPEAADITPLWHTEHRVATLTGLNIANGASFYLQWIGDDVNGGGSRDEYGIDNVQISPTAGDTPPAVANTVPTNNATNVPADSDININFTEAVITTDPWFNINCSTNGIHSAIATGGPQQYTLDPDIDFIPNETCTVTVYASQVLDQDGTIDPMEGDDYIFSFTTAQPPTGWIINEIHADPDAANGDANGDGTVDTGDDEFVEIINSTGNLIDISGWTLNDATGPRHTFAPGTLVPDQCALVIFGGGAPTGTFGDALIQTASNGLLGLNNGGDTLTLNDGTTDQSIYSYGTEGDNNQSLTRDPDITGPEPLVWHSTATGAGGALYSPGTRINGTTPFGSCIPPDLPVGSQS